MKVLDLTAIDAAPLNTDPFDFLVVPGCIRTEGLTKVNADYPPIDRPGNLSLEDIEYGPVFEQFLAELSGPELAEHIGRKFGLDLSESPTTVTVRKYCERSDGNIHTDHPSKIITVLVYFNEQWNNEDGQRRMLRSGNNIEDYVAQVAPLGGTLLAFRRTDHSWHGHTRFVGERRMVQINYLDQSPMAVAAQRISRFGTHFMKNVLGMR